MELGAIVGRCRRVGPGIRAGFWVKCDPTAADRRFSVLHCSTEELHLWGGASGTMVLQGQQNMRASSLSCAAWKGPRAGQAGFVPTFFSGINYCRCNLSDLSV